MKQLLIVTQNTYAKTATGTLSDVKDLSLLSPGAIAFFLNGSNSLLSSAATDNFGIALGQANGQTFVIPEVDFHTLKVTRSNYNSTIMNGTNFTVTVTIPTIASTDLGKTFTIVLVKKGAVPHERNTWTATETIFDTTTQTASVLATKLGDYFKRMAETGSLNVTVSVSGAAITITEEMLKEANITGKLYAMTKAEMDSITPANGEKITEITLSQGVLKMPPYSSVILADTSNGK